MDERRGLGLCQSARRPVQRAARSGISEHRLRAVHKSRSARRRQPGRPLAVGGQLKTAALLHALDKYQFDAAIGGARREEERSRAKERVFSLRDSFGQWDPRRQRPELWSLYSGAISEGETMRVFPLSNWTERDI